MLKAFTIKGFSPSLLERGWGEVVQIEIVLEEADESHYWLEIIRDADLITGENIEKLIKEANELTAIFAATDKTAKSNNNKEI